MLVNSIRVGGAAILGDYGDGFRVVVRSIKGNRVELGIEAALAELPCDVLTVARGATEADLTFRRPKR